MTTRDSEKTGQQPAAAVQREKEVRRALNALDMASGLVSALIRHPGPSGPHENIVGAARAMLRSSDEHTQLLLKRLGLADVPWAQFKVMKAVNQAVADKWRASSDERNPNADVSDLLPVWEMLVKHPSPEKVHEDEPQDLRLAIQLSLLEAISPVLREINVWSLEHEPMAAAIKARDQILLVAMQSSRQLLGPSPTPDAHRLMTSALVKYGGTLYAAAWRKHAERLSRDIKAQPPERQRLILERYAKGFPLDDLESSFKASFGKLTELVNFLAPAAVQKDVQPQSGSSSGGTVKT